MIGLVFNQTSFPLAAIDPTFSKIFFAAAIAFLIGVVAFYLADKVTEGNRVIETRKEGIIDRKKEVKKEKKKKGNKDEKVYELKKGVIQEWSDKLLDQLLAADIMMKPDEFAFIWLGLIFIPAFLAFLLVPSNPMIALILMILGVIGPIIVIKRKQKKRIEAFNNQLGDALLIICNCLRSGLTFGQAMENIADEMDDPIGKEFRRSVNEMNYGASQEQALEDMLLRVDSADLSLAVAAVNIQRQTGGNLSEVLETISDTIRDRMKIRKEIKVLTGQGRASGMIIGLLPIVLAGALAVINPSYLSRFITDDIGHVLIGVCVCMEGLGFFFINKIVDIQV